MGRIILITGGARSGKSSFAERLAKKEGGKLIYIATAQGFDKEMQDRIKRHKIRRGNLWKVIEEPKRISDVLRKIDGGTVLLDCVTLWVNNLMNDKEPKREIQRTLEIAKKGRFNTIIVTNEVGMGIVPENGLARRYRDLLGSINQIIARKADIVFLMCSGIPIVVKNAKDKRGNI